MTPSRKLAICGVAASVLIVCSLLAVEIPTYAVAYDRLIVFKEPILNKVLTNHLIESEKVPNEGSCRVKCYMEPDCVSINIGPLDGNGKITCELNNATWENGHESDLKEQVNYTYLGIENHCNSHSCIGNRICQAGFTSKGFRCKCRPGFFGDGCEGVAKSSSEIKSSDNSARDGDYVIDPDGKGGLQLLNVTCDMNQSFAQSFKGVFPQMSPNFIAFFSAKSCSHLKKLNPGAESGIYIIDPDGYGTLLPFNVTCNMTDKKGVGVTVISHNSEKRTLVDGHENSGSYVRDINYTGANLMQLTELTKVSLYCEQFIKYECFDSRLHNGNVAIGWWKSRDDAKMTYWDGASGTNQCACARAINGSCAHPDRHCNCDKDGPEWREDRGLLTNKTHLPVKQVRFGDTGVTQNNATNEMGYHTLGKFQCYGIAQL